MTLTEFLLARIDEDDAAAAKATQGRWKLWGMTVLADPVGRSNHADGIDVAHTVTTDSQGHPRTWDADHIARWDPTRVHDECEAKRRLINDVHHSRGDAYTQPGECAGCGTGGGYGVDIDDCPTLRVLAQPYAGHDDYRQEWRP